MDDTRKPEAAIAESLEDLKRANNRLKRAITNTVLSWPYTNQCWIDSLNLPSEPTVLLEDHKLK